MGKSQSELLQLHSPPRWKRYESEEEEISETGSHTLPSPTEDEDNGSGIFDDADETVSGQDDAAIAQGLLSPQSEFLRFQNGLASPRPRPLSIATDSTAKRSSAATYIPETYDHRPDEPNDSANDHNSKAEMTDPSTHSTTPILLPQTYYVPPDVPDADASLDYQPKVSTLMLPEDGLDAEEEVLEAKQIMYIAPTSRPSIVFGLTTTHIY
jgi:hypothetical protein